MSKNLKLELNIRFSDKITTDEDMQEIVENVLEGIAFQVNGKGIAPEESEAFVERLEVNEPYSGANDNISFV